VVAAAFDHAAEFDLELALAFITADARIKLKRLYPSIQG
jgi:hypothetical protein